MPMHPKCFELFKRVSQRRLDKIDIDGLWRLREVRSTSVHLVLCFQKADDTLGARWS